MEIQFNKEIFSKRLKELRNELRISQAELSSAIGIGAASLSNYESGARTPDFEKLNAICNYFGVSTDYLLGKSNYRTDEERLRDLVLAEISETKKHADSISKSNEEIFSDMKTHYISSQLNVIRETIENCPDPYLFTILGSFSNTAKKAAEVFLDFENRLPKLISEPDFIEGNFQVELVDSMHFITRDLEKYIINILFQKKQKHYGGEAIIEFEGAPVENETTD